MVGQVHLEQAQKEVAAQVRDNSLAQPRHQVVATARRYGQDDGHQVRWYTIRRLSTWPGKGLATFVSDWRDHMMWADMVMLPDNTKYIAELDRWRDRGVVIVGASLKAAEEASKGNAP